MHRILWAVLLAAFSAIRAPAAVTVALNPVVADGAFQKEKAIIQAIWEAELSARPDIALVDRQQLTATLAELRLSADGSGTAEAAARLGRLLNARYLCQGSIVKAGDGAMVIAKVIDTESTVTRLSYATLAPGGDAPAAARELAGKIVGLTEISEKQRGGAPPAEAPALPAIPADWKRPAMMVIIPEQHLGQPVAIDPAAETEMIRALLASGVKVIDSGAVALQTADPHAATGLFGSPRTAANHAARNGAEVLIYGEAISERGTQLDDLKGCRGRVELKAIRAGTEEVIAIESATAGATDLSEQIAGKQAVARATQKIAGAFIRRVLEVLNTAKPR